MSEKLIDLLGVSWIDFCGVHDRRMEYIRLFFPKVKIVSRNHEVRVIGSSAEIRLFEDKFHRMLRHFSTFSDLSEKDIIRIVDGEVDLDLPIVGSEDILVFGRNGLKIGPITKNQRAMVKQLKSHDMLFAVGPAGSGKTYTAVALAVQALKNKDVRRIVLCRPAVEAGENLGFLPGDLRDKLDPYLQPLYDALRDMLPQQKLQDYIQDRTIEIAPLAFMRGRTLDHAFVILDEAQNATPMQMKMFLTRMGKAAKFIITGDDTQIDLPKNQPSGLVEALQKLQKIKGVAIVRLNDKDVVRHELVSRIIKAYDTHEAPR